MTKAGGSQRGGNLIWITGASQGIGRALAIEMARRGWSIAASARDQQRLLDLHQDGAALPGTIHAYPLDVCISGACKSTLDKIQRELGMPDIAVFNAGTHKASPGKTFSSDTLRQLMELNVMGTAQGIEAVLPGMLQRKRGRIAVVASLSGYRGLPTACAYGASKAALINLCESLRLDLNGTGVKVQVINPGFVKTPLTDLNDFTMPALISAERAARYIAEGLTKDRFEIRFPPAFAWAMGALRHLPYGLYFSLVRRLTGG